jgi:hypothetical protein
MDGCDAAITTLGGGMGRRRHPVDYAGNSNVIEVPSYLGVTGRARDSSIDLRERWRQRRRRCLSNSRKCWKPE